MAHALLVRGFDVYWPATQAGHVDILFFIRDVPRLVQVKSAYPHKKDLVVRTHAHKYRGQHLDYLAVVDRDRKVWLIPWSVVRNRQTLRMNAGMARWRLDDRDNPMESEDSPRAAKAAQRLVPRRPRGKGKVHRS